MRAKTLIALLAFALVAVVRSLTAQEEAPEKIVPATNSVQSWQQVGQQPYEMTWSQREQNPHTLAGFEDLEGWTLELFDGASGELYRSREQQMWGRYVGKIVYAGTNSESHVIARPPKPIPISGDFDSIDIWGYGDRLGSANGDPADLTTPIVDISVVIQDARGKKFDIELALDRWSRWWLIHRRIPAKTLSEMVMPASFAGIEISKITNQQPRYFFCDSLAIYKEELPPLKLKPQPKRNLAPYRDEIVGLNTGPGTLPFPVREQTILPSNFEKDFKVTVGEVGKDQFDLRYAGRDATVEYQYRPSRGTLSEITARVDNGPTFHPLDGGGIQFVDTPQGQVGEGELLESNLVGDVIHAKFRLGSQIVDYELRLWQKSLVLDVWCDGGEATELNFGRVSGVPNPRLIAVPYITYWDTNPRVLVFGAPSTPTFTSIWFDWYRSNATAPYFTEHPQVTADSAEINGGMRYTAKTDGLRNNLYERIFVTSSPRYGEVLPAIPNPPSTRQEEDKYVWTQMWPELAWPASWREDHKIYERSRSYGLDSMMVDSHELTWRDQLGGCTTLTLRAAPQKGGDAMLEWFIQAQKGLGWLQGVYTCYTDLCTLGSDWNPDVVTREANGEWQRTWQGVYSLKPSNAVEFDEYYAKRLKEKYDINTVYTDVHTAIPPWSRVDYDARVPGAGTFAATFYAYGQLLLNDQKVYGPALSEGTSQWLYAGLASGNSGQVYTKGNLLTEPLNVSFMLEKIHPLECNYGMGWADYYLSQIDKNWADSAQASQYVDLFLATTVAYGNMGRLVAELDPSNPFALPAMTRSYYMIQQLQQQYAFSLPKLIEYADENGKRFTPSQALSTGVIADSRLHVVYDNGTEVYVNRASHGMWTVTDQAGKSVVVPPSGWLVFNTGAEFYEVSGLLNNRRIDWVNSRGYEYLDGRGQWTEEGDLGAAGAVALRHKPGGLLELIDIYGNNEIAFAAPSQGILMAYSPDGKNLGEVKLVPPRSGWEQFKPLPAGRSYVFAPLK